MSESGFFSGQERSNAGIGAAGEPVTAPFWDVVGAAAGGAWQENPGMSAYRWARRGIADNVAANVDPGEEPGWAGALLTPGEANERFGITGQIQFQKPISEFAAREIRDLKRRELVRADIEDRAAGGAAQWTLKFAASLAASAVDPLNVASAFVPVVGATRTAAWMATAGSRLGRVGMAARIGAIEGAAGAAMIEPLNLIFANDEQRDYGMADALLNVAFGAILGSGLHAGGRAIADRVSGWTPPRLGTPAGDVHEAMVKAAVAAVAEGQPVKADAVGRVFGESRRDMLLNSAARIGYGPDNLPFVRAGEAVDPLVPASALAGPRPESEGADAVAADVARRAGIMAPLLDKDGAPVIALSREEERKLAKLLSREGAQQVGFVRLGEDEPGAYAVSLVDGAEVYRSDPGVPRVYPSASRAKEAAKQIAGQGWMPVEIEDGAFVLIRAPGDVGARLSANRRLLDVGPAFLRPDADAPPVLSSSEARAMIDGAVRDSISASAAKGQRAAADAWAKVSGANGAATDAAPPGGAAPAIPKELADEVAAIDAVLAAHLASGRLTEADMADVRAAEAGEKAAAERAKGYEAAAACLIGNGA